MTSPKYTKIIRWSVIALSFIIVSLILWNTYIFFQKFKQEQRAKMEILAKAYEGFSDANLNADITLENMIIENNNTIPMIMTDENNDILWWANLDSIKASNPTYLKDQIEVMIGQNEPINVVYKKGKIQNYIYYRDSDVLTKLKYYPIALVLILVLFASVIYLFFKSNKIADQNKLWTGMAKETAHQIGTPLSSLLGWIEILRLENTDKDTVDEIEKDVHRLNSIAERFSKIGSIPDLYPQNIVEATKKAYTYLEARSSKHVEFNFKADKDVIITNFNTQLYGWVIENLVKNAIDAMHGKGKLTISIIENTNNVVVLIKDTGKGIPKGIQNQIFSPGFSTKKRGWGLGLSLAKRIIEDYHNGKISVLKSEINKGTTFKITLKK